MLLPSANDNAVERTLRKLQSNYRSTCGPTGMQTRRCLSELGYYGYLFQRHRGWVLEFMVHPAVTKTVSALKLLSNLLRVLHSFCVHRSRPALGLLSNLLSSPSLYFSSLPSSTSLIFSTSLLRFSTLPCSSLLLYSTAQTVGPC